MKPKKKNVNAWIARDEDGLLAIYFYKKPYLLNCVWYPYDDGYDFTVLHTESFPDVTFENSPIKVSITKP